MSNKINKMFSDIHKNYDLMNSVLSLGFDRVWRKAATAEIVSALGSGRVNEVLDVACGTGKLSIMVAKSAAKSGIRVHVTGMDFNKDMLGIANAKLSGHPNIPVRFEEGDALRMDYPSRRFDIVITGLALRDFDDLSMFSQEAHRVLKSGGKLVILEMSKPERGIMRYAFNLYSNIMMAEGMFVDRRAYEFLVESIKTFDKGRMSKLLTESGFDNVHTRSLPSGAAFLMVAHKRGRRKPGK